MHNQEQKRIKDLIGDSPRETGVIQTPKMGKASPTREDNAIDDDVAESLGSNIDEAYKAIDDFERRREMQRNKQEISTGQRQVQGKIHAVQRLPAGFKF